MITVVLFFAEHLRPMRTQKYRDHVAALRGRR
jgi:hypothetical protein